MAIQAATRVFGARAAHYLQRIVLRIVPGGEVDAC